MKSRNAKEVLMQLMTQEILKRIPSLYHEEDTPFKDKVIHVKYFDPCGRWTFYVTEFDKHDTMFGYVMSAQSPDFDEWGYGSYQEIQTTKNRFKLGMERDINFDPIKAGDCRELSHLFEEMHE